MHTPGRPVSRPWVAAMNAAGCSWRVSTSSIDEVRSDSTTSRFSSPGTPNTRSTPSFSNAPTNRSEPLVIWTSSLPWCARRAHPARRSKAMPRVVVPRPASQTRSTHPRSVKRWPPWHAG